jgi:CRISPR-associated protein Cas5d
VLQIDVLNPIRWESVRRNEVGAVVSVGPVKTAMKKGRGSLGLSVEKERQQRAGLFLRDVAYTIHASFELTDRAEEDDTVVKFEQMFIRRARNGQCFHRPYFGCREFPVDFEFLPREANDPPPIEESRDLGWMLFDLDYTESEPRPQFFQARMQQGCIDLRDVEVRS